MKIEITDKTTRIEADARELRESNTVAGNILGIINRCLKNCEPFDDDEEDEEDEDADNDK